MTYTHVNVSTQFVQANGNQLRLSAVWNRVWRYRSFLCSVGEHGDPVADKTPQDAPHTGYASRGQHRNLEASALVRIVRAILRDEDAVLTVSSLVPESMQIGGSVYIASLVG